jgi:hypothetical protein
MDEDLMKRSSALEYEKDKRRDGLMETSFAS